MLALIEGGLQVSMGRNGPYILLRGLSASWQSAASLTSLAVNSVPPHAFPSLVGDHPSRERLPTARASEIRRLPSHRCRSPEYARAAI